MNLFSGSIIQERVKLFFTQCISNDRLAHAYLFYGNEGCGKTAFAFELAKVLNCTSEDDKPCNECPSCIKINNRQHPDIQFVFPVSKQTKPETISDFLKVHSKNPYLIFDIEGHKNIPIEKIRELKNEAKYAPFEATKRFFIIDGAEYFSRESANSFLKLLEEPPDNILIILITNNIHAILDTIRSRCQPVLFPTFSEEQLIEIIRMYNPEAPNVMNSIKMAQGNLKKVFELLNSDSDELRKLAYHFLRAVAAKNISEYSEIIENISQKRDKNYISEFLDLLILWYRDAIHILGLENSEDIINLDLKDSIEKFARHYENKNFENVIEMIENAAIDIKRNAHPALTLTDLAIRMQEELTASRIGTKEAV
jgi:DNA polymerase-3 subunit delta'